GLGDEASDEVDVAVDAERLAEGSVVGEDEVRAARAAEAEAGGGEGGGEQVAAAGVGGAEVVVVVVAGAEGGGRGVLEGRGDGEVQELVGGADAAAEFGRGDRPPDLPAGEAEGLAERAEGDGAFAHAVERGDADV